MNSEHSFIQIEALPKDLKTKGPYHRASCGEPKLVSFVCCSKDSGEQARVQLY